MGEIVNGSNGPDYSYAFRHGRMEVHKILELLAERMLLPFSCPGVIGMRSLSGSEPTLKRTPLEDKDERLGSLGSREPSTKGDCHLPMETALFINGIYESVLEEILAAQEEDAPTTFLQPYAKKVIRMLKDKSPTSDSPVPVFIATTDNLGMIGYSCEIVGWEDKRQLSDKRKVQVNRFLSRYQPGESDLFNAQEGVGLGSVNLLTVRDLRALDTLFPRSILIKSSDDQPLKERTRSGGWSEVYDVGDLLELQPITQDQLESDIAAKVAESEKLSDRELAARLRSAPKLAERVQTVSLGFRRNPDVIVAALRRAKGTCEKCGKKASFARKSDGTPYLEVHHWEPLAMGGEDTVENSGALCPNCHRECHHG